MAKKYILPSLGEKCTNFLIENLNVENALDVLQQATGFEEKELEKECWKFIESHIRKVVASDSFNNISQTTLAKLLMRDKLYIPEVELFQAVLKWIDFQCSCKNLEATAENQRSIIGKAIYGFRFFTMSPKQFLEYVSKSGLLTAEEIIPIYEKFLGINPPALKWTLPNRISNIVRFSRFPVIPGIIKKLYEWWEYNTTSDRLRFSANKEMSLLGVRLFGKQKRIYHVTFQVKGVKVTCTYTAERNEDGVPGFDVVLEEPVILKRNEVVILSATIKGDHSCFGEDGLSSVTLEGVSATFSTAPLPNLDSHQLSRSEH